MNFEGDRKRSGGKYYFSRVNYLLLGGILTRINSSRNPHTTLNCTLKAPVGAGSGLLRETSEVAGPARGFLGLVVQSPRRGQSGGPECSNQESTLPGAEDMIKFQEPTTLTGSVDPVKEEQGCPGPAQRKQEGAVTLQGCRNLAET
nr:uncharacterized protein LOC101788855 [Cavia porcellus]